MTNESVETNNASTRVGDDSHGVVYGVPRAFRCNEVPQGTDDAVRGARSRDSAVCRRMLVSNSARHGIDKGNLEPPDSRWPECHQGQEQENVEWQDDHGADGINEQIAKRNDCPDDDIEQRVELPSLLPGPYFASLPLRPSRRQTRNVVPEDTPCGRHHVVVGSNQCPSQYGCRAARPKTLSPPCLTDMPLLEWLGRTRECEADTSGCQG